MQTSVNRWGNSLALRLPRYVVEQLKLIEGATVDLEISEGVLKVRPTRRRFTLAELLSQEPNRVGENVGPEREQEAERCALPRQLARPTQEDMQVARRIAHELGYSDPVELHYLRREKWREVMDAAQNEGQGVRTCLQSFRWYKGDVDRLLAEKTKQHANRRRRHAGGND